MWRFLFCKELLRTYTGIRVMVAYIESVETLVFVELRRQMVGELLICVLRKPTILQGIVK